MKILTTKHPHKTRRSRRKFAFTPVRVQNEEGKQWLVWWEHYEAQEIYYARGESATGHDYTPPGWHVTNRHPDGYTIKQEAKSK